MFCSWVAGSGHTVTFLSVLCVSRRESVVHDLLDYIQGEVMVRVLGGRSRKGWLQG